MSGRYPNTGPSILISAGIPIIDSAGSEIMSLVREGETLAIKGGSILRDGTIIAEGNLFTTSDVKRIAEESRANLAQELQSFAENTLHYIKEEKSLILDPVDVPEIRTKFSGRHVLIVVRGEGYIDDLAIIKSYLQEVRPVMIGVDGGADALLDLGFKPDMIVGDMDSVSDDALRCGAEIVVHAYGTGEKAAPGLAKVRSLGLDAEVFPLQGTSEDMAMILAYEMGADIIVAVGTHSSLIDFLDKGRAGMASTFLTRMKIGSKLVDARGVSRLYRRTPGMKEFGVLIAAAAVPVLTVVLQLPAVRTWFGFVFFRLRHLFGL
jgi:uncharacterized membrane-anchored protein